MPLSVVCGNVGPRGHWPNPAKSPWHEIVQRRDYLERPIYGLGRAISIVSGEHFAWDSMNENSPKVGTPKLSWVVIGFCLGLWLGWVTFWLVVVGLGRVGSRGWVGWLSWAVIALWLGRVGESWWLGG